MKLLLNLAVLFTTIYLSSCSESEEINVPQQLVGCWNEIAESQSNTNYQIKGLRFDSDGYFSVTWQPFESYKDYWGSYEYDSTSGSLFILVDGGNYVPEVLDLEGNVQTNKNNELILINIYLGDPPSSTNIDQTSKNYIFAKFSESCSGAL